MSTKASIAADHPEDGTLLVRFAGSWTLDGTRPSVAPVSTKLAADVARLELDAGEVADWDSCLLTAVLDLVRTAEARGVEVDSAGLPPGARRLLALATAVPERAGARRDAATEPFLARVGGAAVAAWEQSLALLEFLGEAVQSLGRFVRGRARFRRSDFFSLLKRTGADALPIVSLISLLVGLILAFVGAVQLKMFGAEIYVASLVGIAMVRVMGAVMTGIIMAGRTGAAFAAELGTMQVNEEIDALETLGVSSFDFLVLPRLLALSLMMPLLCLYANLMGILGGFIVGIWMLGLSPTEYWLTTREAVGLTNLWIGLLHGSVFGVLVSLAGCLQGVRCGRSASAVGTATTSAVVSGIVAIIVATAIITVICNVLGV